MDAPWPEHGPTFNSWCGDFFALAKILEDASNEASWGSDSPLKYLNVRIDTRDLGFIIYDRDGNRISPDRVIAAIRAHREMVGGSVKLRASVS